MELARLAAGDNGSTDGPEQDLSRVFPEHSATVMQPNHPSTAGTDLPFGKSGARMAMEQLLQSAAMSEHASAIFSCCLTRTKLCRSGLQAWKSRVQYQSSRRVRQSKELMILELLRIAVDLAGCYLRNK